MLHEKIRSIDQRWLVCERDYGESEEKGKEVKPFGIGRSEVSVNGREEIESALQRLEA